MDRHASHMSDHDNAMDKRDIRLSKRANSACFDSGPTGSVTMVQEIMRRRLLGRIGEWTALALLLAKGYRPRHRNWRGAGGELDIVAQQREEIVFVEVKTRSSALFGGAGAAVDWKKQRALVRVSSAYLSRFDLWDRPCRFDVVTIERRSGFPYWSIRHFRNAFQPDLGRQM